MAPGPHERMPMSRELCFHEATAPEAPFRAGTTRLRRAAGRGPYTRAFPGNVESGDSRTSLPRASGGGAAVDHSSLMRECGAGGIAMGLFARVKAILLTPQTEWPVIAQEKGAALRLFVRHVAILALIPAMARFIGTALIGWYAPVSSSLAGALVTYLSGFAVVYGLALVIDALAPRFGGQKDFASALKLAAYSFTPVWLAGIFLLIPGLSFLVILGLYGVYPLWAGLPVLMRVPAEKALLYAAAVAACGLIIVIGLGLLEAPLFSPPG
jgi:hypothetical protein